MSVWCLAGPQFVGTRDNAMTWRTLEKVQKLLTSGLVSHISHKAGAVVNISPLFFDLDQTGRHSSGEGSAGS